MKVSLPAFIRDGRGNRVEEYLWTRGQDADTWRRLYVRGPDEAADQIEMAYEGLCSRIIVGAAYASKFNHCFVFPDGKPRDAVRLLDLLMEVVTLPNREFIEAALALDWYKIPEAGVHPNHWSNTPDGELNYRAKYYTPSRERLLARRELVERHADVIESHPLLQDATTVVSVPGHAADGTGFGEQLAARVAETVGKRFVATECPGGARPQAKEGGSAADVRFSMPAVLTGDVIVLDDVWRSGGSMRTAASAARLAGANRVFGLVNVRTMRS